MKREDLGYCGANCLECNIYRVITYGEGLKQETIDRWRKDAREYWRVENLEPKDLNCKGCRNVDESVFFGFILCPIRKCAEGKKVLSCGLCADFNTCEWLELEGRTNLEEIAASEK
ncbi:MAG: DUF3795 domain-containing protein [Dehalococcoidales bacterium]|nr:DUF3795 domain-containing protein [Dehalococcoidales bacterium]